MTAMTKQDYRKLVLDDIYKQTQYNKDPLKNMDLRIKMLDFFVNNTFQGDITDYKKILPDEDGQFNELVETNPVFKSLINNEKHEDVLRAYGVVSRSIYRVATKQNEEDDDE